MEEINEDELILYEESKEIKETIWKIWDLLNDKEIVNKLLFNSPLLYELQKSRIHLSLNDKENKLLDMVDNNNEQKNKFEQNGKYLI
jgi:hypothetical protein